MKKISKIGLIITLGALFIFPKLVFAQAECDTLGNITIFCKNPDNTCTSGLLTDAQKSDPINYCKGQSRTYVLCVKDFGQPGGGLQPAECAAPGQPSTANNSTVNAAQSAQPKFNPDWTQDECTKAGGDWIPDAGQATGPYCYAKQDISYTPSIKFGDTVVIKNLGDYVAQVYNYALGFVLMIAIIMVMIGGIQWIMARGGAGVGAAKKRIGNAILGVVLLFAAYLILNTINPAIVKLSLPRVPLLKQNKFAFSDVSNCGGYKDAASCKTNAVGVNKGWDCVKPIGTTVTGCQWDGASGKCVLATPAAAGGLFSPCPNKNECQSGLTCVTINLTEGCTACTDKQADSPCSSGDDCLNGMTCDDNTKRCRGEMSRPIGSVCDTAADPSQCVTGYCDPSGGGLRMVWYKITSTGICKSQKILQQEGIAPCPSGQFRPREVYTAANNNLVPKAQKAGASDADLSSCQPLTASGGSCWVGGECSSGTCSNDNINRNASTIQDVQSGVCQ